MRNLYKLINFEFRLVYKLVLLISLLLISGQNILLFIVTKDYSEGRYIPFEKLVSISGIPVVFYLCFVLILAVCVYSVVSNYTSSKSIYTLMTIPDSRLSIFLSKVISGFIYFIMLIAAQLLSIFLGYLLFSTSFVITGSNGTFVYEKPVNGLFLAFVRSDFLRLLFPLSGESFISTVSIWVSILLGIFFVSFCILSRKYITIIFPLVNILLVIFVINYRSITVVEGRNQNLYLYSIILAALCVFYVYQSVKWIKNSAVLG
ncbi:MAG: hypothetical protein K0R50_2450 [Eubacterium sp.]|jgi:hypothetical protein|nr:hypothetical protein [Eubacterium sp.]